MVRGRTNPNFGSPLSGYEYIRDVIGVVKTDNTWTPFWLTLYDDKATMEVPKINGLYTFKALKGRVINGILRLDSSAHTEFKPKEGPVPPVKDVLAKSNLITPLCQIPEHVKMSRRPRYSFIEGVIYRIREPRQEGQRLTMDLVDIEEPDLSLRCRLEPWVPLNVDEDSTVICIGRAYEIRDRYYMDTIGVYPIPELSIPRVIK